MRLLGKCSELIGFWVKLCQILPSSGQEMTENGSKWWFPTIIWKSIHTIKFKLGVYTRWVTVQNWIGFRPWWPNFGPLVTKKWLKIMVSHHYLKKYPGNLIQTWCLHLSGDCSELICFLTKFWPSSGQKMTQNGGFRLLPEKVFTQSLSNLVSTLNGRALKKFGFQPLSEKVLRQSDSNLVSTFISWLFRIDSLFGHVRQFLAL